MKLSGKIRPFSDLEAHGSEIARQLAEDREPLVLTVDGAPTAVLQDVTQYEETQEALALLKVLAITNRQVDEGRVRPAGEAFAGIRQRLKDRPA